MPKPWKEFENLVARIERVLAPAGAVVKSNDWVMNYKTRRKRQVDATIRYKVGTTECLIVMECRKRKRRQDDTWIEQLVTKRENLRADRLIAVSETPFTPQAILSAAGSFVELRQVAEVSDDVISTWHKAKTINHRKFMADIHRTIPEIYVEEGSETPQLDTAQIPAGVDPEKDPIYLQEANGRKLNAPGLFLASSIQLGDQLRAMDPPPTFPLMIELRVQFPRGLFSVLTTARKRELAAMTFFFEMKLEETQSAPVDRFYQYRNPEGLLVDVAESHTSFLGADVVVAFHKEQGSEQILQRIHIDTKK